MSHGGMNYCRHLENRYYAYLRGRAYSSEEPARRRAAYYLPYFDRAAASAVTPIWAAATANSCAS